MAKGESYAPSRPTTEGRVYNLSGGDWDAVMGGIDPIHEERLVLNMGPQHPSTHGVLRLVLELEGETVTDARVVVGYLHTGIEKNTEYRTWTQGVTFLTRADYLSPFFNETAYCMGVERLLGVEAPSRAQLIRVLMMEINRLASHWVWLATGGMELGALTAMTNGFRARERCLDVFEMITGLRMNHAYIRPGGVAQDLPEGYDETIREWIKGQQEELRGVDRLLTGQPIWINRLKDVGWIGVEGCIALGITGPLLRAAGLPWDLRKTEPYLGYDTFDFEVPTDDRGDCWSRFVVRVAEMHESLKIVEQVLDRLEPGPTMIDDPKIAWPAKLSLGPDGHGQLPRTRAEDHEQLDGVAHPPLQARHRRLPGAARTGLSGRRVPARRARCARRQRRRHPSLPGAFPGAVVHQPAGDRHAGDRRHGCRRHRLGRLDRSGDGRLRPMTVTPSTSSGPNYGTEPFGGERTRDSLPTSAEAGRTNFRTSVIQLDRPGDPSVFDEQTHAEARELMARYPAGQARSALLPMLHLVQSVQGHVTADGIAFCAEHAGPDQGAGVGRGDVLHDVQALADR